MRIISLVLLVLFLTPFRSAAQTFGGVGTRAEGMGGAFVAVADDASAVYWNPAGIATGALLDFQVARAEDGASTFVGLSLPMVALSYYRTRTPVHGAGSFPTVPASPDRQDEGLEGVPPRVFTASNFGVTVVQSIVPALVVGTTARLVRGSVGERDSDTTGDLDVGAMFAAGALRVGFSGRNLREAEFDGPDGRVVMELRFRVGAALAPRAAPSGVHGPFTVAFDADLTKVRQGDGREVRMAAAGGEYWLPRGVAGVRGGLRWNALDADQRAWSWGASVRLPRSVHVDGQMTRARGDDDWQWTLGARISF